MSRLQNRTLASITVQDWNNIKRRFQGVDLRLTRHIKEEVSLLSGQTQINLTRVPASSEFYLIGNDCDRGRLAESDYTIVDETTIELNESQPEGTILLGEKRG